MHRQQSFQKRVALHTDFFVSPVRVVSADIFNDDQVR